MESELLELGFEIPDVLFTTFGRRFFVSPSMLVPERASSPFTVLVQSQLHNRTLDDP